MTHITFPERPTGELAERLRKVRYVITDADGTMFTGAKATVNTAGEPCAELVQTLVELTRAGCERLFQAGASTAKAAKGMQVFLEQSIIDRLVRYLGVPDARLRVNLIMSYLLGVGTSRYVLRLEPLASMSEEEVVKLVAPTVQTWLDPGKPLKAGPNSRTAAASRSNGD